MMALLVERLSGHATAISPLEGSWRHDRSHSDWRDLQFLLHLSRRAVDPSLSLAEVLASWNEVCEELADTPRVRLVQLESYFNQP